MLNPVTVMVDAGPDAGMHFRLRNPTIIGSQASADLVLHDSEVSSPHCEIARSGNLIRISDRGSHGGTFVDGVRVDAATLRNGQVIAVGRSRLRLQVDAGTSLVAAREGRFGVIVGDSPVIVAARETLAQAATTDFTVLLEGETGTGKELAAEFLHRRSVRRAGPFTVVDCASIPSGLLESELFGHERGSFTGAVGPHAGAFEATIGGTVFLDELSELPPELQPKLLRVLERHEVKRVGRTTYLPVDVRLVAASSRNLKAEVQAGRFRRELYYRLAVVQVRLPPLRDRMADLPLLIDHILGRIGASDHKEAERLRSAAFVAHLEKHAWPGNVRELRNFVERCLATGASTSLDGIDADETDDSERIDWNAPLKTARTELMRRFEKRYLREMLARHPGNLTAAARAAGVDRVTLYRMLSRHGLRH